MKVHNATPCWNLRIARGDAVFNYGTIALRHLPKDGEWIKLEGVKYQVVVVSDTIKRLTVKEV